MIQHRACEDDSVVRACKDDEGCAALCARGWQWAALHRVVRTTEGSAPCMRDDRGLHRLGGWRTVLHRAREDDRGRRRTVHVRTAEGAIPCTQARGVLHRACKHGWCYTVCAALCRDDRARYTCVRVRRRVVLYCAREDDGGQFRTVRVRTTEEGTVLCFLRVLDDRAERERALANLERIYEK